MSTMASAGAGKFSCNTCGKQYRWKPEIAGKRAKCACGAMMDVPKSDPGSAAAAPQPAPARAAKVTASAAAAASPDNDDLYDFAEKPAVQQSRAPAAMRAAAAATTAPAASGSMRIPYRSAQTDEDRKADRFSHDNLTHRPRDYYIPLGMLIAGFLLMIAWTIFALDIGVVGVMAVSAIMTFGTLIKAAVLIGLAFLIAPHLGISFGELRTAILKFAAIILFTDACLYWLGEIIEMVGGDSLGRRARGKVFFIELCFVAAVISTLCYYMFDMDGEETAEIAFPMAVLSHILGWLIKIFLGGVIVAILAAAVGGTPAPAPAPAPAPGVGAAAPTAAPAPPPPKVFETPADSAISLRIASKSPLIQDARERGQRFSGSASKSSLYIDHFYEAGAKNVYLDSEGSRKIQPMKMYVELPSDSEARAKCFAIHADFCRVNNLPAPTTPDAGQRYLVVEMK